MTKNPKKIMTNLTSTFSSTETTGGMPTPPHDLPEYDAYQELINMEIKEKKENQKH